VVFYALLLTVSCIFLPPFLAVIDHRTLLPFFRCLTDHCKSVDSRVKFVALISNLVHFPQVSPHHRLIFGFPMFSLVKLCVSRRRFLGSPVPPLRNYFVSKAISRVPRNFSTTTNPEVTTTAEVRFLSTLADTFLPLLAVSSVVL